jgi:hypothetical protein
LSDSEGSEYEADAATDNETEAANGNETEAGTDNETDAGAALLHLVAEPSVSGRIGAQKFTVMDPKSALPVEPLELARGYGNTCTTILQQTANINDTNIRKKLKEPLAAQLINRLHARYEFLHPNDNKNLKTNRVN